MDGWNGLDISKNTTTTRAPCGANNFATGQAEDAWTAWHWCSSRDLVPVVGGGLRGEYADKMLQDQANMVYSGYIQANTYQSNC